MTCETNDIGELSIMTSEGQDERLQNNADLENNEEKNGTNEDVIEDETGTKLSFKRFVLQIKSDKVFRLKIIHTAILCWSFIGLGWSAGMSGPTFPDLRQIIQEDLAKSAWMFTLGSFGYLSGSLIGGILYDKLNNFLLLAVCSLGSGVSNLFTPYCPTLSWMLFIRFISCFFFGGLDTGGNADIIHVWGRYVDPYMQALHFAFSVGALISPLATEPFLAKKKTVCYESIMTSTKTTVLLPLTTTDQMGYTVVNSVSNATGNTTSELNSSTNFTNCIELLEDSNVHYAFIFASVFMMTSAVGFTYLYITLTQNKQNMEIVHIENESKSESKSEGRKKMSFFVKVILLALLSMLIASYVIVEDSFAGFFMTFSLDYLEWDKALGSFATALFWFSFGVGRFSGIFIVSCCKNSTLLTSYLLLLSVAYIGFLLATLYKYHPLIWVFIAILGFSMSVIFPAIFSWTSEHIIHISGKISALFLTSACLAGMLFPLLIGNLMEHYQPLWYVYILVIMTFSCIFLYFFVRLLDKCCLKKETLSAADDKEAMEETEMTLMKS